MTNPYMCVYYTTIIYVVFYYTINSNLIRMDSKNILILDNAIYDTKQENHRRIIGNYFEKQLLTHLINNGINVKYIAENNRFSLYDFIIEKDGIKYLVELKSRLMSLEHHNIELICSNKITALKQIINKQPKTKALFIFCHITSQDLYEFYYYVIDFDKINEDCFLNTHFQKYTYELPIRYVKPLNEFI